MRKITVSYPILLIVAAGALIIAAAAASSKDGDGAGMPIAALAVLLLLGYVGSRRSAVAFQIGTESIETILGSPKEAADVIAAVETAQRQGRIGV